MILEQITMELLCRACAMHQPMNVLNFRRDLKITKIKVASIETGREERPQRLAGHLHSAVLEELLLMCSEEGHRISKGLERRVNCRNLVERIKTGV